MKPYHQQTYYELLEISPDATLEEIRAAYERVSQSYAPDSVAIYSLADPAQAEDLRKRIYEAYEYLSEPDLRKDYDKSIGVADRPVSARHSAPAPAAVVAPPVPDPVAELKPELVPQPPAVVVAPPVPEPVPEMPPVVEAPPVPVRETPPVVVVAAAVPEPEPVPDTPPVVVAPPMPDPLAQVEAAKAPVDDSVPLAEDADVVDEDSSAQLAPVGEVKSAPRLTPEPKSSPRAEAAPQLPPEPKSAPRAEAAQMSMQELLTRSDRVVTSSNRGNMSVSYIPHPPRPDRAEGVTLAAPSWANPEAATEAASTAAPRTESGEQRVEASAEEADTVETPTIPPEPASAVPPPLPRAAPKRTEPLAGAPEMAQESAIASAEAALAQVSARARENRPNKPFEVPPDAEFNGELLRKIRQSKNLSIQQVADRTKIGKNHLENVEADRYDALPPPVYLRGILMNIAREYGLDALRVSKSYLGLVPAKK